MGDRRPIAGALVASMTRASVAIAGLLIAFDQAAAVARALGASPFAQDALAVAVGWVLIDGILSPHASDPNA